MHHVPVHDERARALFDLAASKPGTAVFVHCGVLSVGVRKKLGLPSAFDIRYGNPLDLHAVALRYPQVPIIIPHFGAGLFREALMVADLCPNVLFDTSSSNGWIKYHPGLTLADVFRRALDVVGPDRLLFGSDSSFFPRGWVKEIYAQQSAALEALDVSSDAREKIFSDQLREALPLSRSTTKKRRHEEKRGWTRFVGPTPTSLLVRRDLFNRPADKGSDPQSGSNPAFP